MRSSVPPAAAECHPHELSLVPEPEESSESLAPQIDLSGELESAQLAGANLRGVNLSGRDLSGADLSGADLSGADLSHACLRRANLAGAKLSGAEFLGADLSECEMVDCHAQQAGFGLANLANAHLFCSDLTHATFSRAELVGADLRRVKLVGARLKEANLEGAHLNKADLRDADLTEARIGHADFQEADLRGARVRRVRSFLRTSFVRADIRDVDFTGAYLVRRHIMDQNYLAEFRDQSPLHEVLYWIWWATSDCGRSALRWSLWVAVITVGFGIGYGQVSVDYGGHQTPLSPYYYSLVTLTTLGYGDVLPASLGAQAMAMAEAIAGYVMLGGLLSILANKMARRAE